MPPASTGYLRDLLLISGVAAVLALSLFLYVYMTRRQPAHSSCHGARAIYRAENGRNRKSRRERTAHAADGGARKNLSGAIRRWRDGGLPPVRTEEPAEPASKSGKPHDHAQDASNLALAFVLLPNIRRMECRLSTPFVARSTTSPITKVFAGAAARGAESLARRRGAGLCRKDARNAVNKELQPFIHQHPPAFACSNELIRGVEMDLESSAMKLRAARAILLPGCVGVGLLSIEIFGYNRSGHSRIRPCSRQSAQLTNILRDVRADAERGRIYLPRAELRGSIFRKRRFCD